MATLHIVAMIPKICQPTILPCSFQLHLRRKIVRACSCPSMAPSIQKRSTCKPFRILATSTHSNCVPMVVLQSFTLMINPAMTACVWPPTRMGYGQSKSSLTMQMARLSMSTSPLIPMTCHTLSKLMMPTQFITRPNPTVAGLLPPMFLLSLKCQARLPNEQRLCSMVHHFIRLPQITLRGIQMSIQQVISTLPR